MAASKEEDEKGDEKAPKKGKDHFVNLVLSFGPSLLAFGLWRRGGPSEMLGSRVLLGLLHALRWWRAMAAAMIGQSEAGAVA